MIPFSAEGAELPRESTLGHSCPGSVIPAALIMFFCVIGKVFEITRRLFHLGRLGRPAGLFT